MRDTVNHLQNDEEGSRDHCLKEAVQKRRSSALRRMPEKKSVQGPLRHPRGLELVDSRRKTHLEDSVADELSGPAEELNN